jgi:hypothetical protein
MSSVLGYQSVDGERGLHAERKMKKLRWRFACNLRSSVGSVVRVDIAFLLALFEHE